MSKSTSLLLNFTIGIIGIVFISVYIHSSKLVPSYGEYMNTTNDNLPSVLEINFPNGKIKATVATTTIDLERGLGNRKSLPNDEGMIFVFKNVEPKGFWMKDMHFPIDIIWIDEDKKVIGINSDVAVETYPNVFFSPSPVKYVLELNAGYSKENNIATGTPLTFVM